VEGYAAILRPLRDFSDQLITKLSNTPTIGFVVPSVGWEFLYGAKKREDGGQIITLLVFRHLSEVGDWPVECFEGGVEVKETILECAIRETVLELPEMIKAIWESKDRDNCVTIRGHLGVGPEGRDYVSVLDTQTGLPVNELEF